MSVARILGRLLVASGTLILVAGAVALSNRKSRKAPVSQPIAKCKPAAAAPVGRDYFSITRTRTADGDPKWLLQGFGRFQCFLFFRTWREALDQANFRVETLATETPDLVQIAP